MLGVSTAPSQYNSTAPYTISLGDTGSPAAKEDTYTERNSLSPFRCWRRYTQSTGYSTKLDHRAFPSYTHSFFFLPSRHQNSTSSPHLLRPLIICWHTSVGVQQSSGKEEIPQSGECARERRCSVEAFKRTEVRRTSW